MGLKDIAYETIQGLSDDQLKDLSYSELEPTITCCKDLMKRFKDSFQINAITHSFESKMRDSLENIHLEMATKHFNTS